MNVGSNIRLLREQRGVSQTKLAEEAGISRAMLCQIERGTKNPSLQVAAEIARALAVELGQLLKEQSE